MSKLIFRLSDRDPQSGGMRAVWYLRDKMRETGCYAVATNERAEKDDVAFYPDNMRGNPLNAARVVRYMCYFASEYFGGDRIPASEMVLVYHRNYLEEIARHCDGEVSEENLFTVPSIEPGLFYPAEKVIERLYFAGKRTCKVEVKTLQRALGEGPIIERYNMPRIGAAALMRSARNLYSLDHHTVATAEAHLAGCKPWHVHALDDIREAPVDDAPKLLQDEERDKSLPHVLMSRIRRFFHDNEIGAKPRESEV